jgi:PAS domain-containing protein
VNETDKLLRELADLAQFPEMNPGAVIRLDRTGTVLLANRAARGLFKTENIVGRKWMTMCPDFTEELWNEIHLEETPSMVIAQERHSPECEFRLLVAVSTS